MTDQAKQKMRELAIRHANCFVVEPRPGNDLYNWQYDIRDHFEAGYSTAMSEAQGLIDALEYVQSGLLFSDLDTQARSNALDKIDHAIKQFRQEIES